MKDFIKKILRIINRILYLINLQVSIARRGMIPGVDLFSDLRLLISSDFPICLDVGANKGQTIDNLLGTLKNPYIYSFEPSSSMFKKLTKKNYGNRVFLFNYGLGSKNQEREFINYQDSCLSSFLPLGSSKENRFKNVMEDNREIVQIKTIDTFLSQQNIEKVNLLKIDTQGFDLEVLLGAEEAFKAGIISYVLIEINFVKMYEEQATAKDIISFLERNGLFLIDYYEKVRQVNTLAWCTALFGKR